MSPKDSAESEGTARQTLSDSLDLRLKLADLETKLLELSERKKTSGRWRVNWGTTVPVITVVLGGLLGFLGNLVVNSRSAQSSLELETLKAKNLLIVEAVKTGTTNRDIATQNLLFFLDAKLITDPHGTIRRLLEDDQGPVLPTPSFQSTRPPRFSLTSQSSSHFVEEYIKAKPGVSDATVANLTQFLTFLAADSGVDSIALVAYIIATVEYETGGTFDPAFVNPGTEEELNRRYGGRMGNTEVGDGFLYRDRGYIAFTGKRTYAAANRDLGLAGTELDLVAHPEVANRPSIAYQLVTWMIDGAVRGTIDRHDYTAARMHIVGAPVDAAIIGARADQFITILSEIPMR